MNILALDTSSPVLSLALFKDKKLIDELESKAVNAHSSILAPSIEKILKESRLKIKDVNWIVVGLGPGSFTGLRIGLSTARTLSYATGAKLAGVPSFEALALHANTTKPVAIIQDAKKEKFYTALYQVNGSFKTLKEPKVRNREEFLKSIPAGTIIEKEDSYPKARYLLERAWERIQKNKSDSVMTLEPLYLYPRDCNVTLSKKKK